LQRNGRKTTTIAIVDKKTTIAKIVDKKTTIARIVDKPLLLQEPLFSTHYSVQ